VIENILRLLEQRKGQFRSLRGLITEAVTQMGRPILFSKAILLTAFIPLYTLQRVEGRIFRPMALTLSFALIVGTVFGVVIVPVLASFAVKSGVAEEESWIVRWLLRLYQPALAVALKSRRLAFVVALALLAAGAVTYHFLGSGIFCPSWTRATCGCGRSRPRRSRRRSPPGSPRMSAAAWPRFRK